MAIVEPPRPDPLAVAVRVWEGIQKDIDDRFARLTGRELARVFSMNVPFGSDGVPVDAGSGTSPLHLMELGVNFPCRITGWSAWCHPSGTITFDVRRRAARGNPLLTVAQNLAIETQIITATLTATTYRAVQVGDNVAPWPTPTTTIDLARDDILSFYVHSSDAIVEYGVLLLALKDLTIGGK